MNKILLSIFLLMFSIAHSYGQSFYGSQYLAEVPVNDSITSTPMSDPGPGGCYPSASYTVIFPVSKVTGIRNYLLITAVSPGNSAYTTQLGVLHLGDTLFFTPVYPSYDFYFPKGGGIIYMLKASGTPKTVGESYPCGQFVETTNTSGCPDVISYTFIQSAKVQSADGKVSQQSLKIIPLAAIASPSFSLSTTLTIDSSVHLKDARIELYDNYGRKRYSAIVTEHSIKLYRNALENGTYFWKVINNNETIGLGKVNITQ